MSNFDEKSGLVYSITPWGQWAQTIEEVFVEVKVPEGTRSRDVKCDIKAQYMSLSVHNKEIIKVPLILIAVMVYKWNVHLSFAQYMSLSVHNKEIIKVPLILIAVIVYKWNVHLSFSV